MIHLAAVSFTTATVAAAAAAAAATADATTNVRVTQSPDECLTVGLGFRVRLARQI